MAGHHIQWIGSFSNIDSLKWIARLSPAATNAATNPTSSAPSMAEWYTGAPVGIISNRGRGPSSKRRTAPAVTHAMVTGTRERGFHSNNRISTASNTADMGQLNVAAMPAEAPATISTVRSDAVMFRNWPSTEPIAPPVMITGPSAPKGPPEPIEIAVASGFRTATLD